MEASTSPTSEPASTHAADTDSPEPSASAGGHDSTRGDLAEEAALLQKARDALARGDVAMATHGLDAARARFPRGLLAEERDALEVRAAFASGDRARGQSLIRAFVERYPRSPLRRGIEALAGD